MQQEQINLRKLAQRADLNAGTLSSIFNHQKRLTVDHLDRLTSVMSLPEGHFYEQYVEDFLLNTTPDWRRIRPFLYRCAALGKADLIRKVVGLLLDHLMYSPLLFDLAEEFYQNGNHEAAAILFENVAASEKHQHSERLAFCHYRMFLIKQGDDLEQNRYAAIQFEPYVDRLDEFDQLDALRSLLITYRTIRDWNRVEKISLRLNYLATIVYNNFHSKKRKEGKPLRQLGRPLFFYIAHSKLLLAASYYENEHYEQALKHVYEVTNLDWVKEKDEHTQHWKVLFLRWAKANILLTRLMAGETNILEEYVSFFEPIEDEIITGLWNITKAANKFDLDIDHHLYKFEQHIMSYKKELRNTIINGINVDYKRIGLMYELSMYFLRRGRYDRGFRELVDGLGESAIMNDESSILRFMRLFETYREFASPLYQEEYHLLAKIGG
ncbi:transcriptional regulator [Paenibacillus sp. DYY-L-2]|uniref:transcriptional regulator n=1 Tax=Paenibacillus sp. DYY-L-2 TaxID=3447013 RepID=UPI003F4FE95E